MSCRRRHSKARWIVPGLLGIFVLAGCFVDESSLFTCYGTELLGGLFDRLGGRRDGALRRGFLNVQGHSEHSVLGRCDNDR